MDSPKKQASKILRDKKMYQRWLAIFMCLALVVTSGTVTALKLTGQAWTGTEQVLTCTYQPHQHTPECYNEAGELVCGLSDKVLHTHDARCYDSEGSLICTMEELEEHSHTSECYTEVKTLICTEEEHEAIPAHKHSDECYTTETVEQKDLTCGLEEGANAVEAQPAVEGHHHTDACYTITPAVEATYDEEGNELTAAVPEQRTLTCGLEESEGQPAVEAVPGHVHTEECYTTQQVEKQVLTCGLEEHDEEIPAHHHSDECYTTEMVLNCDKPELIAHEHTDDCYEIELDADGNEISRTLTCKLPQLVAHQHGDECFTEVALEAEGTYCGKEAHKHTGSCYMDVNGELVLTCGKEEHVHTDECFVEPVLYCGKQEHTHTEECYDADGNLICELEEHTHTAECYIEPEIEPVEVTETVANRFYNVELTAVYTGELAEEDELAIVAATTSQEEMETERDYAYSSQVPDSKVLPLGRTEFILTKNGEEVDRSEYAITATIIPSRESVAYLAMSQGDTDIMMLDEGGEPGGEQTIVVSSGFTAYELEDGKLAPVGYVEAKLDEIDLDTYMAEAYDEEGNPTYDESLAIHAHLSGSDFMLTAGVEEDVIQTLNNYDKDAWNKDSYTWWDGMTRTEKTTTKWVPDSSGGHYETVTTYDTPQYSSDVKLKSITLQHLVDAYSEGANSETIRGGKLDPSRGPVSLLQSKPNDRWFRVVDGVKLQGEIFPDAAKREREGLEYKPAVEDFARLKIVPEDGYYVTAVIIACVDGGVLFGPGDPFECGIMDDGNAFTKEFSDVSEGLEVSLDVSNAYFSHGGEDRYCILVSTSPIPSPLYVQYDAGEMTGKDLIFSNFGDQGWLVGGRTTVAGNVTHEGSADKLEKAGNVFTVNERRYTVPDVSEDAKKFAQSQGLRFAGWELQYYKTANVVDGKFVSLQDKYSETPDFIAPLAARTLQIHAKLTAKWEKLPAATITKQVDGLDDPVDTTERSYSFELEQKNGDEWQKVDGYDFTITVMGQSRKSHDIEQLPDGIYRVVETTISEDFETTYARNEGVASATPIEFTVNNSLQGPAAIRNDILVLNDYETLKDQQVTIYKVDASNNTENNWPFLAGAKFTLTSTDPSVVIPEGALKAETGKDGIAFSGRLPVGTYTLTEDKAPAGYTGAADSITFKVDEHGVTVTRNAELTVADAFAVHKDPNDRNSPIIGYEIRVKNTVAPAQVKVIKVSNQNKETTLPDAHFDLYKEVTEDTAGAKLIYDKDDRKIYGIKVNENDIITDDLGEAMLVDKTLTDGSGLQFDQRYYLIETQAPAGYNGSDQPIELYYYKVTGTQTFELEVKSIAGSSLEAERVLPTDKENPVWGVKVPNSTGTEMPHTGGMGTGLFTVGGGLLMVLAAGLYFWNKRRISEM